MNKAGFTRADWQDSAKCRTVQIRFIAHIMSLPCARGPKALAPARLSHWKRVTTEPAVQARVVVLLIERHPGPRISRAIHLPWLWMGVVSTAAERPDCVVRGDDSHVFEIKLKPELFIEQNSLSVFGPSKSSSCFGTFRFFNTRAKSRSGCSCQPDCPFAFPASAQ
jgi:hypothetical protein